ncbi:MAG: hypothetical protein KDA32_01705 [Phycisphaerales bacterium]|nr:hypothetical protein [Phycisphaerales bacterium]
MKNTRAALRRRLLGCAFSLFAALQASADSLRFTQDADGAITTAKRDGRLLMFLIFDRSRNVNSRERNRIKRVLQDPQLAEAERRFIPVELNSAEHLPEMRRWGLGEKANFEIAFVTPSGKLIHHCRIGTVDNMITQIRTAWTEYGAAVYNDEVEPALTARSLRIKDVRDALLKVRALEIQDAGPDVLSLLDRDGLSDLRPDLFRTLAALSAPRGVRLLLDRAAKEPEAADALTECTPMATELLLEGLVHEDPATRRIAYRAVTEVCRIPAPKTESFWEKATAKAKRDEIRRVRELARKYAAKYQQDLPEQR